jgi:cardiolipin synthase A/B
VPDTLAVHALTEAMKRSVKLRIVVPGEHIDSNTVRSASCARPWREKLGDRLASLLDSQL